MGGWVPLPQGVHLRLNYEDPFKCDPGINKTTGIQVVPILYIYYMRGLRKKDCVLSRLKHDESFKGLNCPDYRYCHKLELVWQLQVHSPLYLPQKQIPSQWDSPLTVLDWRSQKYLSPSFYFSQILIQLHCSDWWYKPKLGLKCFRELQPNCRYCSPGTVASQL